jgi:hypothetical protein
LNDFIRRARENQRPTDGFFVTFWRLLVDYPELLAWEKLWTDGKHAIYGDIYRAAKKSRPSVEVGFHIWHANSFSPFFRAEQDYAEFARSADFLKIVLYNNCGGPRYANYIDNVGSTIFRDVPREELTRLHNQWLDYPSEPPLEGLATMGLSPDYVYRETRRALTDVAPAGRSSPEGTLNSASPRPSPQLEGEHSERSSSPEGNKKARCKIYPGIDIDIPTGAHEKQTSPDDVRAATAAALRAGAEGVIFSRKYSEMKLDNLAGGGAAVREAAGEK